MLFEHNLLAPTSRHPDSAVHNECMYVDGGNRSVYRGNLFIGCPTMALSLPTRTAAPAYRDVLVENNIFGHTLDDARCLAPLLRLLDRRRRLQLAEHVQLGVRYNTFETGTCVDDPPRAPRAPGWATWAGSPCVKGFAYRHNVGHFAAVMVSSYVSERLNGRTTPNNAPFYVNAPSGHFRLRAGSAAINRGDPQTFPRLDGDRKRRPLGGIPDAGAYERS